MDRWLCPASAQIKTENVAGKVHHKFAVIDVEGDDLVVILGSYNWMDSGAYDNDENTLIIHDRDLARAYHAEWEWLWSVLGAKMLCSPLTVCLPIVMNAGTVPPDPADVQVTDTESNPLGGELQGEHM